MSLSTTSSQLVQVPFTFAKNHGVLVGSVDEQAEVFYRPGLTTQVLLELRRVLKCPLRMSAVSEDEFQRRLVVAYRRDNSEAQQAAEDLGADIDLSSLVDQIPEASDLMDVENDAPVIRLINAILSQAIQKQASDIHVETFEDKLTVRYRIDGVLVEVLNPKRMLSPLLVSRLKVMAKLDIAEKRIPQDGRISIKLAGHAVDVRVSTIPSAHGERVVLRLLDKQAGLLQLDMLQMPVQVESCFKKALSCAHGIILVTGPTGSGKTTSLYAGLSHINNKSRNILTIEDPIEYVLPGIGQTQVNSKVDMTFSRGLRAILRQDPDVVMVGEIRDRETAEIAVQASLTGHLVLSTLHTNTALGAITRLQDMGVEPFLISSSLIGVMAQRLVRQLCLECRRSGSPDETERKALGLEKNTTKEVYYAAGCSECNYTGYKGRTGIYELVEVDSVVREMIHRKAGEAEMEQYARTRSPALSDDGRRRVLAGETTLEEVMRVTVA
ncbi:type II secretion system protein GspE [Motiliproteus coralliicola]|uniref:Type II secretion system protein E n=1 Tax=Motiliproteus coralliicola TaxID=2283196 RepID=A0A369WKX8_9GAMM|nr:type II secretion system ATPase GspE [Motiliproteus coralliicola]RDE22362.1 type II secretion system protein GspE [Motiliproteus coralliicola]